MSELEIGYGEHIRVVAKWSPSGKQGVTMSGVAGTFSVPFLCLCLCRVFVFVFVYSNDYLIALIISFQNMYVYRGL